MSRYNQDLKSFPPTSPAQPAAWNARSPQVNTPTRPATSPLSPSNANTSPNTAAPVATTQPRKTLSIINPTTGEDIMAVISSAKSPSSNPASPSLPSQDSASKAASNVAKEAVPEISIAQETQAHPKALEIITPPTATKKLSGGDEAQSTEPESSQPKTNSAQETKKVVQYSLEFIMGVREKFHEKTPELSEWLVHLELPPQTSAPVRSERSGYTSKTNSYFGRQTSKGKDRKDQGGQSQPSSGSYTPTSAPNADSVRQAQRKEKSRSEDEQKIADAYSILNKLAPQTFEKLFAKFQDLKISKGEIFRAVIKILFEMAVHQAIFCPMYAKFCFEINRNPPKLQGDSNESFLRILLTTCQEEFEREKVDAPENLNPTEAYEFELKRRRRQIGNIRFISEIYKIRMLPDIIIVSCINTLMSQSEIETESGTQIDAESVECLCNLLVNIGGQFSNTAKTEDRERNRGIVTAAFENLHSVKINPKTESRIRFMIMDAEDTRSNNWVPRRVESKPKTIDEVRKEAYEEEMASNELAKTLPKPPPQKTEYQPQRQIRTIDTTAVTNANQACKPSWMNKKPTTASKAPQSAPTQQQRNQQTVVIKVNTTPGKPSSSSSSPAPVSTIAPKNPLATIDTATLISKFRGIADEFLASRVESEFFETLKLMDQNPEGKQVLVKFIESILTKSAHDADILAQSFKRAFSQGVFSQGSINGGLVHTLSNLDDMRCDAPKIIEILSVLFADLIVSGDMTVAKFVNDGGYYSQVDPSMIYSDCLVEFLCALLNRLRTISPEKFQSEIGNRVIVVSRYIPEGDDFTLQEAKKHISAANLESVIQLN